jgi:hypothetical protein
MYMVGPAYLAANPQLITHKFFIAISSTAELCMILTHKSITSSDYFGSQQGLTSKSISTVFIQSVTC